MTVTVTYKKKEFEVTGEYTPESPGVPYLPNGDPGDPPEAESFDIESACIYDVDISDVLSEQAMDEIEELAIEAARDYGKTLEE